MKRCAEENKFIWTCTLCSPVLIEQFIFLGMEKLLTVSPSPQKFLRQL